MDKKHKNILVVNGVLDGHFTGSVEIVRELVSLGHNVTCYVFDKFADRLKDVGAKLVVYTIDRSKFKIDKMAPPFAIQAFVFAATVDSIMTLLLKDENKYDYYIFDSLFHIKEMNKVFKIPDNKFVLICTSFIFTDEDYADLAPRKNMIFTPINMKYKINIQDFLIAHYTPNKYSKLILTSKLFHLRSENTDDTCFFMGPFTEKRKKDENFNFKKDKNKKLIYISLGTIFNKECDFYSKCIEAFKDSEDYQVVMSVGKAIDIKQYGDIPKNISIFNYVPQVQLLADVDIFITHGGLNSIQEGLLAGIPLIVIPQRYDQLDNARRIEQLEAGIFLDKNKIDVDVLKKAVNDIVSNKEKYKKGVEKLVESFKESRDNRKNIYEKLFV